MNIETIIEELVGGKAIILATETVYGIASFNPTHLYQLKQRPRNLQLPRMYGSIERVLLDIKCNYYQERAIRNLIPGPFTLLLRDKKDQKIAIRIPEHDICIEILQRFDRPLFVTSANLHGQKPAVNLTQAKIYFPELVGIDCGESKYKKSSMIIDLTGDRL